jgi:hypothetical protein
MSINALSVVLPGLGIVILCSAIAPMVVNAAPPEKEIPNAIDAAKGLKAVTDHLEKLKGQNGAVAQIKDEPLERLIPDRLFFTVLFRQYPVGRRPPEGLNSSNVFAVDKEGKITVLKEKKELEDFFKANVVVKDEAKAKDAVRTWLRLSQEFLQDGFFKFNLMDDSTKVTETKPQIVATGKLIVMQGGNGEVNVKLTFDEAGRLTAAMEEAKFRRGPRPICQATKLLDADPIVRQISEQDLLIMGRAAKPYLDEQRAKAKPELQMAIDRIWERIVLEDE